MQKNIIKMQFYLKIKKNIILLLHCILKLYPPYVIFINEGKVPSNHVERFRILELKYYEIYKIIDKDFPFYQDSYRTRLTREVSLMLKNDAKKLSEIIGIKI